MNYAEEATAFECQGETLLGVLARPATPSPLGVLVIVGGPQTRVGSHRQFVLLSRALAAAGYAVLRFDYRGMGDSGGPARDFSSINPDIAAAMSALQAQVPEIQRVLLWGLCDGASAALLYVLASRDPRIAALCLLNPWVRSEASLARTHLKHYYRQRLAQKEFWLKLLRGKVALEALRGVARSLRQSRASGLANAMELPFQQRMAAAARTFAGPIRLILSGDDYVAKEFLDHAGSEPAWREALARMHRVDLPGIDHTFSSAQSRRLAEQLTLELLAQVAVEPAGEPLTSAAR